MPSWAQFMGRRWKGTGGSSRYVHESATSMNLRIERDFQVGKAMENLQQCANELGLFENCSQAHLRGQICNLTRGYGAEAGQGGNFPAPQLHRATGPALLGPGLP